MHHYIKTNTHNAHAYKQLTYIHTIRENATYSKDIHTYITYIRIIYYIRIVFTYKAYIHACISDPRNIQTYIHTIPYRTIPYHTIRKVHTYIHTYRTQKYST